MTERFIVTGGGGFVGKALCRALRARGAEVIAIGRGGYPDLLEDRIEVRRCDIGNADQVMKAFEAADAVFHTAAKVDMWGAHREFVRTNVEGTKNVIAACRHHGIPNLIFTSSPSVIANGKNLRGVDERTPYPKQFLASYPETKAAAERLVREAGARGALKTITLRPHLIFGPGDTNLMPNVVRRAKRGSLMRVGNGDNLVDFSFIEDCVQAHVNAYDALVGDPDLSGKVYFISQGEPVRLWGWIDDVLDMHGAPRIKKSVPGKVAYSIAWWLEKAARVIPGCPEPRITRFLVCEMETDHYFCIDAARRDLDYRPGHSMAAAMQKTKEFLATAR